MFILLFKITNYLKKFLKENKRGIRLTLSTLSGGLLVLFLFYFSRIDFNYRLIGYFPVNSDIVPPQEENGTINEDYPWEFKEIWHSNSMNSNKLTINITKEIESVVVPGDNATVYFYLIPLNDYGKFTLDYTYNFDDLSEALCYVAIDQSETDSILGAEIQMDFVDYYYVTYILHHKYNCWVPCYSKVSKSNIAAIQIEVDYYHMGMLSFGTKRDDVSEHPVSNHFYDDNYTKEMAMESFASYEGKKVIFDEFEYDFEYKIYVDQNSKEYEITRTSSPNFSYLRNEK